MANNRNRNRRSGGGGQKVELWGGVPVLEEPAPIVKVDRPGAVLRSLGDPPLQGRSVVAGHYLEEVVKRASQLATALATAAGLAADDDEDDT
jgi:hypothetical protein